MLTRLLPALLAFATPPQPSHFYSVGVYLTDTAPHLSYRILEHVNSGTEAIVRYIQIAPLSSYCPRPILQAREIRIANQPQLPNPCAIDPNAFHSIVRQYSRTPSYLETASFGIVAHCGGTLASFSVPIKEAVDLGRLRRDHPEIAAYWTLQHDLVNRVFGRAASFDAEKDIPSLTLQQTGQQLAPDLLAGRFDPGLALAKANRGGLDPPTFRKILRDYRGPVTPAAVRDATTPKLLNAGAWRFVKFTPPENPLQPSLTGPRAQVDLELTIDPTTGNVTAVKPISGHPILIANAAATAGTWQFVPHSTPPTIRLTLDFTIHCP